jgi:hypothetical protein
MTRPTNQLFRSIRAERIDNSFVTFSGELAGRRYLNPLGRMGPRDALYVWITDNCLEGFEMVPEGVEFQNSDDALLCYMAWK